MNAQQHRFDVIVVGVGGMGSAACYHLARRGAKVLGLEQFDLAHAYGSSHGETRLIRQAYFEHPAYVPLLKRAYHHWHELEAETALSLMHLNGVLIFGPPTGGRILPGVRKSGETFAIPLQHLDSRQAQNAHPLMRPPADYMATLEPGAGYLLVEDCVRAHVKMATRHGATIEFNQNVLNITPGSAAHGGDVRVTTAQGTYTAPELVITAGPWSQTFLPELAPRLKVHRVMLYWFQPEDGVSGARHARELPPAWSVQNAVPCFGFDMPEGFFYGVPAISQLGVKVALHVPGPVVSNPTELDRRLEADSLAPTRAFASRHLAGLNLEKIQHAACMYTMTPDEHFIVGKREQISFAAGFSGHGFKFAPVMGEALADLALTGKTALPTDFLRPTRW